MVTCDYKLLELVLAIITMGAIFIGLIFGTAALLRTVQIIKRS